VKQFCKEHGLTEHSFYAWRKRLQEKEPIRFALVGRRATWQERAAEAVVYWCRRPVSGCASARSVWRYVAYGSEIFAGMIHLPASVRVYLYLTASDMRKSFDDEARLAELCLPNRKDTHFKIHVGPVERQRFPGTRGRQR